MSQMPVIRPGRLEDAASILDVQARSWQATYAGLLPERIFPRAGDPGGIRFWEGLLLRGDTATRVVAAEGALVGFVSGGPRRDPRLPADGEVYALYLLPDAKRRGLGSRLLRGLAGVLEGRGCVRLGLWVLAGNVGAQAFYAYRGGEAKLRQVSRERGVEFDEIAYVWDPIDRASS